MLTNVDFNQSSLYQSMRDLAQVEVTRVQRVLEAVNAEKTRCRFTWYSEKEKQW